MVEAQPSHWFEYYGNKERPWKVSSDAQAAALYGKLRIALETYTRIEFDHIKIAHLGRRIAVFVVKGDQSAILYDKTRDFPSAKLLASLVLLGSP